MHFMPMLNLEVFIVNTKCNATIIHFFSILHAAQDLALGYHKSLLAQLPSPGKLYSKRWNCSWVECLGLVQQLEELGRGV